MKHWFVLLAATAAIASFAPAKAQVAIDTPVGGVRIGEPPPPRVEEKVIIEDRAAPVMEERDVRMTPNCETRTVQESSTAGTETRSRTRCD